VAFTVHKGSKYLGESNFGSNPRQNLYMNFQVGYPSVISILNATKTQHTILHIYTTEVKSITVL